MATTYIEYDGTTTPAVDGINTDFTFPFPYLKIEDVRASINGVGSTAFTINPATPTLLEFTAAPTSGATVRIYRQTDPDATPATFFAGSSVRAKDLNDNFDQILFIMQERQEFLQDLQLGQLPTGGLGTAALQDDAVTAAKLRDDVSIDGNRAVTTDHIRDNAITTAKIAADNVTMDKLGSGALPTDITVASANIVDGTIVTADIADDAITEAKIADGEVVKGLTLTQTSYAGTSPITVTEPTTDNKQINIASTSNAYGIRHVSASLPTAGDGSDGDIWYVT
jgi:hypothetical protein